MLLTRGQQIRWWLMRECMSFYVQCVVLQCYEAVVIPVPVYGSLWLLLWSFALPIVMQFLVLQDDDEREHSTFTCVWMVCWWTVLWICWFVTFWSVIFVACKLFHALWTFSLSTDTSPFIKMTIEMTTDTSPFIKKQTEQDNTVFMNQFSHACLIFSWHSILWLGWINTCPPLTVELRRVPLPRLLFCYSGTLNWRPSDPRLFRNE